MLLRLPRKFKKRVMESAIATDEVKSVGRKGGKVKRERIEARLLEEELRQYLYR